MKRTIKIVGLAMLLIPAAMTLALPAPAARALTARANHDDIKINLNYHGSTVSVSGECDEGVDLIVKISTEAGHEKLMRKDRMAGVVWMNVEELTFEETPYLYILRSAKAPEEMLNREQLLANNIGYVALTENAEIKPAPDPATRSALFGEFIKYKEAKSLYSQSVEGVEMKPGNGGQTYTAVLEWPYQVPPGQYQVTVFAVKNGEVVDKAVTQVTVEEDGIVKTLADMAGENGALYGIAAIGVAISAGFGVGMIFGKGGGAH